MACSEGIGEDCVTGAGIPGKPKRPRVYGGSSWWFLNTGDLGHTESYLDTCHAWKAERQGAFTLVLFVDLAPAKPGFCEDQHVDTLQG